MDPRIWPIRKSRDRNNSMAFHCEDLDDNSQFSRNLRMSHDIGFTLLFHSDPLSLNEILALQVDQFAGAGARFTLLRSAVLR